MWKTLSMYISTAWKQHIDFYTNLDFTNWSNPDFHKQKILNSLNPQQYIRI